MAPHRILAVRRGALGDFILTLPALRAMRERWPQAEIQLLTSPAFGAFAVHFRFADTWRSLDSASAAALFLDHSEIDENWKNWLGGFDRIISWLPDRDGTFRRQILSCGPVEFHQAPWECSAGIPAARQFGGIMELDCAAHVRLPLLKSPVESNLIALHPGSGGSQKNWPFKYWLEVMKTLRECRPQTRWLLVTGETEEERLPEILKMLEATDLKWASAHALELVTLAERLGECAAFLGHDSGVSHLASACGVPCHLLFGPTDPAVWAPASNVRVLRASNRNLNFLSISEVVDWLNLTN